MLFSGSTLEGNESKSITQNNAVNQNTINSRSSQSQINEEVNVNKAKTKPSHQFVEYNVGSDFTQRKAFSRADKNSKRLILDNYLSSELQTDIVIAKDALFKYRASPAKYNQQSENVLRPFNEEPKKKINWRFSDDEENAQHKSINSVTDGYFVRNDSPSVEQNKIQNLYEAKPRHFKRNYDLEDFAITETENKNGILNDEKYAEQITLNADITHNNTQFSSPDKNPIKATSFGDNKQLGKKTTTNSSRTNLMKPLITSTKKHSPPMDIQEVDNQTIGQDGDERLKNEDLPQNDVYVEANQIFDPTTNEYEAQPLQETLSNSKSNEHSSSVYVEDISETHDHSFSNLAKDHLDLESEMGRDILVIKNIQPRQVSQDVLKSTTLQQSEDEQPQTDPELDLFKKELSQAQRLSKVLERLIQFVNIVGQIDSYVTDKARSAIRKLASLYGGDNDQSYNARCA
jgi:hypothetical protein